MARPQGRSWALSAPRVTGRRRGRREQPRVSAAERKEREERRPPGRRPRSPLSPRSLAGQVFVLQVFVVLLLVVAGAVALVLQAGRDSTENARNRSLAVAESFAYAPGTAAALASPHPTAVLQPRAEQVRRDAGVDFLVVMNPRGIRYTHPNPAEIGRRFVGDLGPARSGQPTTETVQGTLGRLVQAIVPVPGAHGRVVGLVAAGIRTSQVSGAVNRQLPILLGAAAVGLALATGGTALVTRRLRRQTRGLDPAEMTRMYEHHDAVLHAVREGVLIVGGEGRLVLANDEARRLLALPPDAEGRPVTALGLTGRAAEVLTGGEASTDQVVPAGERLLAVSVRPTDRAGGPPGYVATLRDTTELRALSGRAEQARTRLRLLYEASMRIGTTLEVSTTADELVAAAVPRFADYVTVDLLASVLEGEEPRAGEEEQMCRAAVGGIRPDHPLYPRGSLVRFSAATPMGAGFGSARAVLEPDLRAKPDWFAQDREHGRQIAAFGIHSLITAPIQARGVVLGLANFYRSEVPAPFEEDDLSLAVELTDRAAVCIDNARRYTREHTMAVTLQHSLLPRGLPDQHALDVAYRYLPARAGVGGDWFDVIALPGARVALVVGDVVGHGLHAAATMGRLRTAVRNFSSLDLPPDELLGHLDELVSQIDQEEAGDDGAPPVTGATCLYAVYDPAERRCTMARAGHVEPAVTRPDGTVGFLTLPAGPPLGLSGMPFEAAEVELPEGSHLVLYTDGLVEDRTRDIEEGLDMLRAALTAARGSPEEICRAVLDAMLPPRPSDDIALLVARTRALRPDQMARWEVPSDPAAVSTVRAAVTRQLTEWGLEESAFTAELVLSELITNAIRHASGPIGVRLLRDHALICEVSDTSSTSPHLRYAATTDEGGRGLFLVAQFADRWGTRYTATGKVIWAELALS
ncbi:MULTISPECIES: SpoIIE family protein phosphatase/ATP-binding protein [Streptomycetaceae]|uniref:Integral membrane sensor protein n=1 Tax=Streptantibioticus cattleyicolor (strain ATCC 35852 / DSM 46488 / JCM 4925 / NBRC 14057 / NRRL 8057) TaxID=1003195 RepID=F8K304_STREN|nr:MULTISPECIES: SpoIIE family protein phosphatase/ATP-binding protein [Streptomycetaceae]AEW92493.1 integral membrane sensor protein [Streptantibioticus cattleyicolor NRRL 8057 = DSM 46488]MYS57296.1 SpoIIE family protein phosphatase [Streptomyces sp. SID5468]CCB72853.1 putative integral membrane sensor protein [Streptantibioticus cattleyicolor NRRL 8057 = DSM 46488]